MHSLKLYVVISLSACAWLVANVIAQPHSNVTATIARDVAGGSEADYAPTLDDPFCPIGYRPPIMAGQISPAEVSAVSNVPPPNIDLKVKAKAMLRVRGILKRGDTYVANINGAIVRAGDEVGVTVDGQTVMFVIRAISLKLVQIEPRE